MVLLQGGCERASPGEEGARGESRANEPAANEPAASEAPPVEPAEPVTRPVDPTLSREVVANELSRWLAPRHAAWLAARSVEAAARAGRTQEPRVNLQLPESAHEPFQLEEPSTGVAISVQQIAAEAIPREHVAALHVYPEAAGPHTAVLLQPSELGLEDYVAFAETPPAPELEYRVALGRGVAGLRRVERTLEFLDASGAPRLRVARPFLIGADGAVTHAELAVLDCAVDDHPMPPRGAPRVAPGATACRVRVSWHGASVAYPALVDPLWGSTASMAVPRERFASLVLPDGRVLAAGGITSDVSDPGGARGSDGAPDSGATNATNASSASIRTDDTGDARAPTASAEIYDATSGTWSVTGSLNTARSAFTLTATSPAGAEAAVDAGAIAIGGEGHDGDLASTELYDPVQGSWELGPALPVPSSGHAAARLADGTILVASGSLGRTTLRLAVDATSWQLAGGLRAEEPGASLTPLGDGGAVLIGPNAPRSQRFIPNELGWVQSGTPGVARSGHSATRLLDGQVLIVGGGASQRVELYDPTARAFRFTGGTSEPHDGHSATLLSDGRVAIIGGAATSSAGGVELYDPAWGTWTPGPGTATLRSAHRAELLDDGRVLAFGGLDDGRVLAGAELLDASPVPIERGEYQLPARVDATVTVRAFTELWASVTRPATLVDGRRYPVLLFLHGNHGTCGTGQNPRRDFDCSYTARGSCPPGFAVVQNHRGYDYASALLAARGFIVVSVNANRGITCGDGEEGDSGFNLARGRLLLRHLQQLAEWDRGDAATPSSLGVNLSGKLDLNEIGLMGHSRGGEGSRAAYEQYREEGSPWPRRIGTPVVFRAIFEIGPVDGQTSRQLNADGVAWAVLLPMCDGDVSDLQGVRPFDRMLGLVNERRDAPKSTFVAWGANHNYFNTEWQESDSPGCENHQPLFVGGPGSTGSAEQRQIALRSLLAFFAAHVGQGKNQALGELFDPSSPLASSTRIDRGHTPSLRPSRGITLEDFSGPTGSSARGLELVARDVELEHGPAPEHDPLLRAASIEWFARDADAVASAESARYLELPVSAAPQGIDLGAYTHLEFRAGRLAGDDLLEPTPLVVELVNADGSHSEPVDAEKYGLRLDGPVGGPYNTHLVLQTARIPLAAFAGASREALRGVRFTFPGASGAHLYLASVRASLGSARLSPGQIDHTPRTSVAGPAIARSPTTSQPPSGALVPGVRARSDRRLTSDGNTLVALRRSDAGRVEIELASPEAFRARDDQLLLEIGEVRAAWSRHPDGDLTRVIFSLPARAFATARDGERLRVRYTTNDTRQWDFGALDKSRLTR